MSVSFLFPLEIKMSDTSILEPPFKMIVTGASDCGKTYYLLQMLEQDYKGVFDRIFILCPTLTWNSTYMEWKHINDQDVFLLEIDHEQMENTLKMVSEAAKGTNSLIICDDLASGQTIKNSTSELVRLAFSGRHYGISVIVLTQHITAVSFKLRTQIQKYVLFYPGSHAEQELIFKHIISDVNRKEFGRMMKQLRDNDYARLEILKKRPYTTQVVIPRV